MFIVYTGTTPVSQFSISITHVKAFGGGIGFRRGERRFWTKFGSRGVDIRVKVFSESVALSIMRPYQHSNNINRFYIQLSRLLVSLLQFLSARQGVTEIIVRISHKMYK